MKPVLELKDVSTGYSGKHILQHVSLSVSEGEVLSIIGQNGCGKSTLLKTIARDIPDHTGDILFYGGSLNNKNLWELKSMGISWFVQGGMVFPTLKVREHFELAFQNKSKNERSKLMEDCLHYFPDLKNKMETRGGNLSGGERQMLSFSMLLAQETTCWLLDEPTAGLAPERVKEVIHFLEKMKKEKKITMILVEHNYQVAFSLADHVAIIKDGEISQKYKSEEFKNPNFVYQELFN